ncbi:hypothetical protein HJC23_007625, partial [Cyclotella cryptica]
DVCSLKSLDKLAAILDKELYEKEWFDTSRFDDRFEFQEPDVKLTGLEEYARGVPKLFDQSTLCAEMTSTVVNTTHPIQLLTCGTYLAESTSVQMACPLNLTSAVLILHRSVMFQEDCFDIPGKVIKEPVCQRLNLVF